MKRRVRLSLVLLALAATVGAGGCDMRGSLALLDGREKVTETQAADRFAVYIRGKRYSHLSYDQKQVTMSLVTQAPDGEPLSIEWGQDKPFGVFNTNRGSEVQWTVTRKGNFAMTLFARVTGQRNPHEPEMATFTLQVDDGRIKASDLGHEISLAPQSVTIFRPLPATPGLDAVPLASLGIRSQAQLSATSYTYDQEANAKEKVSGDYSEVRWSVLDPALVTVDDNGLIRPADEGGTGSTTVIAASKSNPGQKAACLVSVRNLNARVTLSYPTTTLSTMGSSTGHRLAAHVQYSNPIDRDRVVFTDHSGKEVSWSSSDPSRVQIDPDGTVRVLPGAQEGDVTLTATSNYDPGQSASVTLHVVKPTSVPQVASSPTPPSAAGPPVSAYRISLYDISSFNGLDYSPRTLEVPPGTTVEWVNQSRLFNPILTTPGGKTVRFTKSGQAYQERYDLPGQYKFTVSGRDYQGIITVTRN